MATNVTSLLREGPSRASRRVKMCNSALTLLVIATLRRAAWLVAANPPFCTLVSPHPGSNFPAHPPANQPEPFERGALSLKSQTQPSCLPAARRKRV